MPAPLSEPTATAIPTHIFAEFPPCAGGGVQPFAILLVLSDDLTIAQFGANAPDPWNRPGRPLSAIFSPRSLESIRAAADASNPGPVVPEDLGLLALRNPGAVPFRGFFHRDGDGVAILELIPEGGGESASADRLIRRAAAAITPTSSIASYGREIVDPLRAITGYDRALLCQLGDDSEGLIVAESSRHGLPPVSGLRVHPASVAPRPIVAGLHRRVDVLADAEAPPVPLLPIEGAAPSLARSALSAQATPEYRAALAQLGVRAALVAPIFVSGEPWGFLACHHEGPRPPDPESIRLLETLASLVGAQAAVSDDRRGRDAEDRRRMEEQLRESESRYALAIAGSNDGIWEWHPATGTDYLSPRWKQLLGYAEDELLDHEDSFFSRLHPDDQDRVREEHRRHFIDRTPYRTELRLRHKDGGYRWFLASGQAEWDEEGNPIRMAGSIADITEARQARARLEEALRFNEKIISTSAVILYIYDPHSRRAWLLNRSLAASLGWDQADLEDKGWDFLTSRLHPGDAASRIKQEEFLRKGPDGTVAQAEWRLRADDGQWRWFLSRQTVLDRQEDGSPRTLLGMMLDVTERKRADEAVLASLEEKETLLREIHHRVKNNLAVIVGLLGMQARRAEDPASREVLRESRNRIHSMASVHEMLYQSRRFSAIDLAPYVQQLGGMLLSSYDITPGRIAFVADVAPVSLDLNTAIPFGLILNELISNALKHAFPDGRTGRIALSVAQEPSGMIALSASDDGVGVPEGLELRQSRSLGLRLVRSLTEQIGGTLTLESGEAGATFLIRFPARCEGARHQ